MLRCTGYWTLDSSIDAVDFICASHSTVNHEGVEEGAAAEDTPTLLCAAIKPATDLCALGMCARDTICTHSQYTPGTPSPPEIGTTTMEGPPRPPSRDLALPSDRPSKWARRLFI